MNWRKRLIEVNDNQVKMNRPEQLGCLKCRVCGVAYQTRVHYLNEPVDVYSEWIDAAAENQAAIDLKKSAPASSSSNVDAAGAPQGETRLSIAG